MNHFFESIKIDNFKSLRNVELNNCKRINLFIGKPNVGKSNILEALSLFSLSHGRLNAPTSFGSSLQGFIRAENENELFFNGEKEEGNNASVVTNLATCTVSFSAKEGYSIRIKVQETNEIEVIDIKEDTKADGNTQLKHHLDYDKAFKKVKKYTFNNNKFLTSSRYSSFSKYKFLRPPFGGNLMKVIENNSNLSTECDVLFKDYGLQLAFDQVSQSLRLMRIIEKKGNGLSKIVLFPYSSIADTLQRIIFFKAAIVSNTDSILLFEEPEAHSFPPYIAHITQEIINATTNQFFITTHSPFVLNDFLENAREDLAVHLVDWKDGETTVKRLSDADLHEIYQYGIDLFTNLETFI